MIPATVPRPAGPADALADVVDQAAVAHVAATLGGTPVGGTLADWATTYAANGWEVFPLRDKTPAIGSPHPWGTPGRSTCKGSCRSDGHGVHDATSDHTRVTAWWRHMPWANIGARIPRGLLVVDIDPRHDGHSTWERLAAGRTVPAGRTSASGRGDGGRHLWFTAPPGPTPYKKNVLGHGIEVLTWPASYVVLPPSIHPDTGRPYRWTTPGPAAVPPAWLLEALTPPLPAPTASPATPRADQAGRGSPADWYETTTSWAHILTPAGWRHLDPDPDADGTRWRHPTATEPWSATISHGRLFVYSPNTPFQVTTPGDPHGYTRFHAHAVLTHGGDRSAAARAIAPQLHASRAVTLALELRGGVW